MFDKDVNKDVVDELLSSLLETGQQSVAEEVITKEQTIVRVRLERRKRHLVTVIEIDSSGKLDIESLARELKRRLAAGGTVHESTIELQGDHRYKVKKILMEMGFKEENILIDENVPT